MPIQNMLKTTAQLCALLALINLVLCFVVPWVPHNLWWLSVTFASSAFLLAVTYFYRYESRIHTAGGWVYKDKQPVAYFISHLLLWIFGSGFFLASLLALIDPNQR
ncbi:hypothetical protein [Chitinimonas sp.]|uniref:hypothetical protein n=1 Tax=Chitinimonas sp. TaxID=1934313 RepID=UPI002F93271F